MITRLFQKTRARDRQMLSHYGLLSVFFFAGLEVAFAVQQLVYISLLVLMVIVIGGIFVIRYEELGRFSLYQAILPSLAVLGLAAFALFLPASWWLHAYMVGAAACTYFVLKHGAKQAYPTWNTIASLITLFVVLATVLGARFHFYIPVWTLLVIVLLATCLTAVQFFLRYTNSAAESWLLAASLGVSITQITWAFQFLPLHFLVQAGVLISIYYIAVHLAAITLERVLARRDIIEYFVFGSIAIIALVLTARWY